MGNEKKLPESLAKKQELQRQETINKVLRAIADIKNEGRKVTISVLVEFTGLLRSTFAKLHIRKLLLGNGYSQKGAVTSSNGKKKTKKVSDKDDLIANLRIKNAELERECELLRGRLFLIMQKQNC
jgi:hypothetical protein